MLPYEEADGPGNMARDEALLDAVAADPELAAFRTYGWTEPTLSLGYFQAAAPVVADPRWSGVARVRRPSGGGALWHHHEVTYALAVPRTHPLAARAVELYRAVHAAIAAVLEAQGVVAARRGPSAAEEQAPRPFLCFADRDAEDLLVRGAKVLGSAQRRRRGAVLQHGALLLRRSPHTPELPGLADLTDLAAEAAEVPSWARLLRDQVPGALGLRARDEGWTARESARVAALEREVYRNPSWTCRR